MIWINVNCAQSPMPQTNLKQVGFYVIYSSRGFPTTKCTMTSVTGRKYFSSCPSGASTGSKEAVALTDGKLFEVSNENKIIEKYQGRDVHLVIQNAMRLLVPQLLRSTCSNIYEFDQLVRKIDGTENFNRFGANIALPLSICFSRMVSGDKNIELYQFLRETYNMIVETEIFPKISVKENDAIQRSNFPSPNFNILNGGAHSGNDMPFQEIMINFSGTYRECLCKAAIFYNHLKTVITHVYGSIYTGYGDEGGYMPPIRTLDEAIMLIRRTNADLGYKDLRICVDAAANEFFIDGKYNFNIKDEHTEEIRAVSYTGPTMVQFYIRILEKYEEIFLLEDPFAEEDYESWKSLTNAISERPDLQDRLILGDDLVVTNPRLIRDAISHKWCNSVLIKPNQIGNVTETIMAIRLAHENGLKCMVSHRSGETEDDFIADLAVGTFAHFIKAGSPRGERLSKYNRLLEIYNGERSDDQ